MREITGIQFQREVIESNQPCVVDLWAPWCQPCLMLNPILSDLSMEYNGRVDFLSVDIDKYPEIAKTYQVSGIPMLLFFKNKNLVNKSLGVITKGKVKEFIENMLKE